MTTQQRQISWSDRTYPWPVDIRRFVSCNLCRCLGHFIFQGVKLIMSGVFGSFSWKASIWFGRGEFGCPKFWQLQKFVDAKYKKIAERKNRDRTLFVCFLEISCVSFYSSCWVKRFRFPAWYQCDISVTLWYRNQTYEIYSRWWQLKHFLFSTRKLGKMNPFWRAYFSDGLKVETTNQYWTNLYVYTKLALDSFYFLLCLRKAFSFWIFFSWV